MKETKGGVMGVESLCLGVITLLGEHMERRSRVQVGRERESGGVDGEERWTAGRGKGESVVGRRDKAKDNKRRCVRDERKMNESHVVDIFTIWQGKPWQSRSKKKQKNGVVRYVPT